MRNIKEFEHNKPTYKQLVRKVNQLTRQNNEQKEEIREIKHKLRIHARFSKKRS